MSNRPQTADKHGQKILRWLFFQTIAAFAAVSIFVFIVTGDWRCAVVFAAGADLFFMATYAVTGQMLIKSRD